MANGDAAAAAGMDVVPSTGKVKLGYDEINKTRDYIILYGIPATGVPISKGGTGATTLAQAKANLGINPAGVGAPENAMGTQLKFTSPQFGRIAWEAPGIANATALANLDDLNGKVNKAGDEMSGFLRVLDHIYVPNAFGASTSYTVAYINGDGRLARGTSSRRFKANVRPVDLTKLGDVLQLAPVTFTWRASVDPNRPADLGLIAEDVAEVAPWLVVERDGQPEAVRYEMIGLALLPVVKALAAEVAQLRAAQNG